MFIDLEKNIRDMFVKLSYVRSLPEAEQLIETFPKWSGDWTITGNVDGSYRVTCTYTDKNGLSDTFTEAYDWADIVLEWNDISFGADNTILVDNTIFDADFEEGMHIRILFSDRDKTIYEYEMRSELEAGIVMALVNSYPALSYFTDQTTEETSDAPVNISIVVKDGRVQAVYADNEDVIVDVLDMDTTDPDKLARMNREYNWLKESRYSIL